MPSMDSFLSSDLEILKKYNYVISKIEVVAWGEVLNHDGSVIECVFKISDVVKAEELY
jgi:regulatory protein YycH of two-component signal transduction system YycFG